MKETLHKVDGVSVLLPVYCAAGRDPVPVGEQLAEAIRSVLTQDVSVTLEIVCVDDGSAVPVAELLESQGLLGHPALRLVRHHRNYGLVHALNTALASAHHELIGRIDADDIWLPGKLASQVAAMAADPDLSLIATGMRLAADPPQDHLRKGSWTEILRFFEEVGCPFPHGSILARRRIFRLLGGYSHDPAVRHCEDYALWGTWLRFFKVSMLEEILFEYRPSDHSVSTAHVVCQRQASGRVNLGFRRLPRRMEIPVLLPELAQTLGVTVMEAGIVALSLWRLVDGTFVLPPEALPVLRGLLPDRDLLPVAFCLGAPHVLTLLDGHATFPFGQPLTTVRILA